jgi:hypothetical protein
MKKILLFLIGCASFLPHQATACTIPVYRFALEKWELTPYEILVFHRGGLPVDVQKTLKKWSRTPLQANIDVTLVDLDSKMAPHLEKLWQREGNEKQTPWMLVRSQAANAKDPSAWAGPCTTANLQNVIDSPQRQAIRAHLQRGVTGVYVLLKSGDEKADNAAYEMALAELQSLEKKIKLPVQSKDGPQLRLPLPLQVMLPLVMLDRDLPEEAAFVRLLLATEEGLARAKGPILFPIFGRGRVLCSLSEEEFTADKVQDVTKFLCRECSCELKELNPGVDMLLAADWNAIFDKMFEAKETNPVEKRIDSVEPTPTPVSTPVMEAPSGTESVIEATSSPCVVCENWLWIATGIAAGLVLITGAWACFSLRK